MNAAFEQAKAQAESIAQMVAALGVDYDELGNLREHEETSAFGPTWGDEYPEMCKRLAELGELAGDVASEDEARERIVQDPLSVEVRSGWVSPGQQQETGTYDEFKILLCTGGPAVRIMGTLDRGEPSAAWIEYQDWGTPWTKAEGVIEHETLLAYCSEFYFGE